MLNIFNSLINPLECFFDIKGTCIPEPGYNTLL